MGFCSTAAGVSQMPLITWANRSAVSESRMTTDAFGPIAAHSPLTAVSSPAPIFRNAIPWAVRPPFFVTPRSRVVSAVGMSSDATQQEATMPEVILVRPSWEAWSLSQAAAHSAPRIRPGSTNGTSRRLAHGWSGETAGRNSTVTITQIAIISGSAQTRATALGSDQVSSAFVHRRARIARPNAPSSTAGAPRYQITQYRLSW